MPKGPSAAGNIDLAERARMLSLEDELIVLLRRIAAAAERGAKAAERVAGHRRNSSRPSRRR